MNEYWTIYLYWLFYDDQTAHQISSAIMFSAPQGIMVRPSSPVWWGVRRLTGIHDIYFYFSYSK